MSRAILQCVLPAAVAIVLLATACTLDLSNTATVADTNAALAPQDARVILITFDENSDAPLFAGDRAELLAAPTGTAHRIAVSDARRSEGIVQMAEGGTYRDVHLAVDGPMDAMDGASLAAMLTVLAEVFPADAEILAISGHGREWNGIGLRDEDPGETLSPTDLALALSRVPPPVRGRTLVLDGSMTGSAELIVPLGTLPVQIVAAPGVVRGEGIDYSGIVPDSSATAPEIRTTIASLLSAACADPLLRATAMSVEEVVALPALLSELIGSTDATLQTAADRDALRAALLGQASSPVCPGAAWTTTGQLADALGAAVPDPVRNLLLYLSDLDINALPDGVRPGYRSDGLQTELAPAVRNLSWAPDFTSETGFLYRLWYASY